MNNLIDVSMHDDIEKVYALGLGCHASDLTEEEIKLLNGSNEYLKEKDIKHDKFLVKSAYEDFEKLSKIKDIPCDALEIISKWVNVDGFDDDEEDFE